MYYKYVHSMNLKVFSNMKLYNLHKLTSIFILQELVKKKSEEIVKSVAKPFNKHVTQRKQRQQPVERSVTLPSIKDFSFG